MTPKRVEQLMSRSVATCGPDDGLEAAARIMWDHDCGIVPVTVPHDGGERVVGMVSDRDICMAAYTQGRRLADIPVSTAMSDQVRACGQRDSIHTALRIMATCQIHRLPVLDERGRLVGVVSLADVARQESRSHDDQMLKDMASTVEAICMPRPHDVVAAA
jgi:CBS domain-containing protein